MAAPSPSGLDGGEGIGGQDDLEEAKPGDGEIKPVGNDAVTDIDPGQRRAQDAQQRKRRQDDHPRCLFRSAVLAVILIRTHRPEPLIVARGEGAVGLGGIAIDQRPQEHRMRGAAHFVFDREEVLAA